jgi:putative ABC transport system permease protein
MNSLLQDVPFALRQLRKNPGFTTVAVLTLALGIGANTAIFSTVSALLLHPQNFPDIGRLILLREGRASQGDDEKTFAPADFSDIAKDSRSFDDLTAFRYANFNLTEPDRALGAEGALVASNFFPLLGVKAALGRTFNSDEDQPGRDQEVLISHRYWAANFGSDRSIVGQTLRINGREHIVIGIMPKDFNYPVGIEMWAPLAMSPKEWADRTTPTLHAIGKLKPGISLAQAAAEMKTLGSRLVAQFPKTNSGREITLLRLREEQYQYTLPMFLTLQAAAAFVLLLVCANLGSLLFARLMERQREIAIRSALGADWLYVARVLVSENLLLSLLAGAMGVAVSFWGVILIRKGIPIGISKWIAGWDRIRVDASALSFALLLTLLLGLVFGLASAMRAAVSDPNHALKEGAAGSGTSAGKERLRSALVVTQVVMTMVLLVGAGLMAKGLINLAAAYQGLQPAHVVTMQISLAQSNHVDDVRIASFYEQFLRSAAALPGVQSVGIADNIPASNIDNSTTPFTIETRPALRESDTPAADLESISANFLSTLRIPLVEGRSIGDQDGRDATRVAVISHAMAQRFWPKQSPIGQRLKLGSPAANTPWIAVVGVVDDVKQNWWDPQPRPIIYLPYQQAPQPVMNIVIRTVAAPLNVISATREVVRNLDPEVAPMGVQEMNGVIVDALSPLRIIGILMNVFGAVALTLTALGVFGVLAHAVAQRTREFGIRMALGASPGNVLKFVVSQALRLVLIGLAIALPISIALARFMASWLSGIGGLNAPILAGFAAVLVLAAFTAAIVPARRAAKVDPMVALRYE